MRPDPIAWSTERLLSGVRRFQRDIYPPRRAAYEQVAREGQSPHALFITCADSRIDPELITQSGPGEIFVSRNIGNLVPAYGVLSDGMSAIIEYGVAGLKVSQVVVCGHTDCGAMIGLLHTRKVANLPIVKSWLRNAGAALSHVGRGLGPLDEQLLLERLIEANVVLQLNHLKTHPSVAVRLSQGKLALSGWVYDIGRGSVSVYQDDLQRFFDVTGGERAVSADPI